jgi:hypothetical protein
MRKTARLRSHRRCPALVMLAPTPRQATVMDAQGHGPPHSPEELKKLPLEEFQGYSRCAGADQQDPETGRRFSQADIGMCWNDPIPNRFPRAPSAPSESAGFDPERCIAAFEGDVEAQRSLIKPHLETMVRFPCVLKEFVAARFATSTTTRVGRNGS